MTGRDRDLVNLEKSINLGIHSIVDTFSRGDCDVDSVFEPSHYPYMKIMRESEGTCFQEFVASFVRSILFK